MNKLLVALALVLAVVDASACTKPRNTRERDAFVRTHACPATGSTKRAPCPGYVIDHVKALCKGGTDTATNMQWQTVSEAAAKDKWECKK